MKRKARSHREIAGPGNRWTAPRLPHRDRRGRGPSAQERHLDRPWGAWGARFISVSLLPRRSDPSRISPGASRSLHPRRISVMSIGPRHDCPHTLLGGGSSVRGRFRFHPAGWGANRPRRWRRRRGALLASPAKGGTAGEHLDPTTRLAEAHGGAARPHPGGALCRDDRRGAPGDGRGSSPGLLLALVPLAARGLRRQHRLLDRAALAAGPATASASCSPTGPCSSSSSAPW